MKAAFGFLFVTCINIAFSQIPAPIYLRQVLGKKFEPKPYTEIQGSPYLGEGDGWMLAQLKVEGSNEIVDSIRIRLNIYENKIHFLNENGEEMQTTLRVEAIKIIDSASLFRNHIFLSSFTQDDGFFEVLENGGKLKLLKKYRAYIWEAKAVGSEPQKRIDSREELFLCLGRILYHTTKDCNTIYEAFEGNEKILNFISANNIRCNREGDLRKLVQFYKTVQ